MRSPLERSKDHYFQSQARQLVGECESFLDGTLPAVLERRGLPVPEWAWLSMLAHSPADALEQHVNGGSRGRFRSHVNAVWLGAIALLAQELVMVADRTGRSIEDLQHLLILDVELNWERSTATDWVMEPSRFVEQVRRALGRLKGSSHSQ